VTADNPLLQDFDLPPYSAIRPEHVEPAVDAILADSRVAIAQLLAHVRAGGQATLTLCGEAQALHFKRARSALIQRFQSFFKPKTFNSLRNQL